MGTITVVLGMVSALYGAGPITPIPKSLPYDRQKAALGEKLFFDPILSKDRTIACVSCHHVRIGGADTHSVSTGVSGRKGNMNTPTVLNAVFNFSQFWNGRAKTLHEQALGPIQNPVEMALPLDKMTERLQNDPVYSQMFSRITGRDSIAPEDIGMMIAEYEKTLITPNSKLDRYLRGEGQLSSLEKKGYELFKTLGCVSCHNGVNIGGNSYQKAGAIIPITRKQNVDDRYALTKREWDKNVFKVPTLRNIALTAPYFHNGSVATLPEAVEKMAYHNLGLKLSKEEVDQIVAFLGTLTGELPRRGDVQ